MSCWVSPTLPTASWMTGSSISTSLRAGSFGISNDAHDTIATSLRTKPALVPARHPPAEFGCASYVVLVGVVVGVRLTGRPEVLDVAEVRLAVRLVDPDGLDPHAEPDLVGVALLDEEHRRDVGAVVPDPRTHVRRLEPGARDPGDAEGADGALAGQRHLLLRCDATHRAGAARRHVDLAATGAALAHDAPLL